jgi:hypothetical protein
LLAQLELKELETVLAAVAVGIDPATICPVNNKNGATSK